jgi:hypothetical protein
MVNLSYAPVPADDNIQLPNEAHLCIKIIEILKLSNDLEKSGEHRISEEMELALL